MGTCCAIQQHALQHCQNPFPMTLLSQVLGLKFLRVVAHFKMAEIRDIFRRHLTEAEREVRRRYQATDASLNILEDFSRVSDWALTQRLERPSKKYQHDYVQSFPIVKREFNRIRKIPVRKTRPRATLSNKWKTIARRSIPKEIFANVEHYLADSELVDDVSRTDRRITLTVNKDMEEFFKQLCKEAERQQDILERPIWGGGETRLIVSESKPVEFYYSYKTETLRVTCHYGFWNAHGVPQHIR